MRYKYAGLLLAGLTLASAGTAAAAPVTVHLRVEGHSATLYEGTVTTDVGPFQFTAGSDQAPHTCDGTGQYGSTSTPSPTRGAALAVAARTAPFAMSGSWSDTYGSFSIDSIAGESVAYDASTFSYLAEYKNGAPSMYGACGDTIAGGDDVVFAWGDGSQPVLALSGPATAAPGAPVAVKVTDEASRAAVAGAAVGGATSGADGTAAVTLTARGPQALKATKNGTIRSNAITVCVTDGQDGYCGTTKPDGTTVPGGSAPAPAQPTGAASTCQTTGDDGRCGSPDKHAAYGFIASQPEGKHYAKGHGPRQLAGRVADEPSGIADVRLRLTRNDHGRCATYDGKREALVRLRRCGALHGRWFSAGTASDWSYLLPAKLGRGRYVLDVQVVDRAGNRDDKLARGRNRVVFFVG